MQRSATGRVTARLAVIVAMVIAAPVHAGVIDVDNAGFEDDVNAANTFTFGAPTGWQAYNAGAVVDEFIGTLNPTGTTYFPAGAPEGSNVAIAYSSPARILARFTTTRRHIGGSGMRKRATRVRSACR